MSSTLVVLQKPKFREPCNRCGECCRQSHCELGIFTFRPADEYTQCPALEYHDGQFSCGLVIRMDHYIGLQWPESDRGFFKALIVPMVEVCLGIGQGCGMPDDEARPDPPKEAE